MHRFRYPLAMTSFGTEITTGQETYRFVMRETDGMSLMVFRNTLYGLDRLLWAVGVGVAFEEDVHSSDPGLFDVKSATTKGEVWSRSIGGTHRSSKRVTVGRQSPAEPSEVIVFRIHPQRDCDFRRGRVDAWH